jgi:hypothetical protein
MSEVTFDSSEAIWVNPEPTSSIDFTIPELFVCDEFEFDRDIRRVGHLPLDPEIQEELSTSASCEESGTPESREWTQHISSIFAAHASDSVNVRPHFITLSESEIGDDPSEDGSELHPFGGVFEEDGDLETLEFLDEDPSASTEATEPTEED